MLARYFKTDPSHNIWVFFKKKIEERVIQGYCLSMQIDNVQVSKKISKQEKLELHSTYLLVSQYSKQGGHWCWVVIKTLKQI
jgi:hypothetical protein